MSLDAPSDATLVSPYLARIVAPQAYEFTVRPLRVSAPYPSTYAHTVDVWFSDSTGNIGFAAAWLGNGRWAVYSYTPRAGWYYGRSRFDLALGDAATFRITKHNANTTEFFVNGISMESINDGMEVAGRIYARVLGMAAEISWVPLPTSGAANQPESGPLPCLFCPAQR
ncbi:MAG: hypothetical protein K1Y01_16175 [Vicinamibacteria bacterium]|nr:hypothetical protein [Vicinamibacteria bacterium]